MPRARARGRRRGGGTTSGPWDAVVAAVFGYIAGSVPVSLRVARRHGVGVRGVGDGTPGAWNALEALGARRAWPAFVGDGLKGLLAGVVGALLGGGGPRAAPPRRGRAGGGGTLP